MSHAVTVPPGRGGGRSGGPSGQTQTAEQITEAMAELGALAATAVQGALEATAVQGAQEAMAGGLVLVPRPGHSSRNPSTPQKNFPGEVRGYQEPSGVRHTGTNRTGQESPPGLDKQDKTGPPTLEQDSPQEQEALLG